MRLGRHALGLSEEELCNRRGSSWAVNFKSWAEAGGVSGFLRVCSWVGGLLLVMVLSGFLAAPLFAKVTGSISGTVRDAQGAVIPGATVQARNTETGVTQSITTDSQGFYNFPALAIGHYDVSVQKTGFGEYRQTNLMINVDTALQVDATMQVGAQRQQVTVKSAALQVNTRNAQIGEVLEAAQIQSLPLNGRAFTDLLALQPGVVPINASQFGTLSPSGNLDGGVLSMSGGRVVNNGYMINGANTVEGYEGGTTIIPNLDSIAEFRIITSDAGAEYGNYAGGQVNVVTKGGTNSFHGDGFEFVRNSALDARNFFSPDRGELHQNMFGGTFGGPIMRDKAFFFVDYQGTRQTIGVDTGLIPVPSDSERTGDFSDNTSALSGVVSGPYFANLLGNKLGYAVSAGEPYYTAGCTSSANCVFPNAVIPQSAWTPVSSKVLTLIPTANQGPYFTTSANPETLQDDKGGVRVDVNTRIGMVSGYYFDDPWNQLVPYNAGFGGSSVPGFPGTTIGKAQLFVLSDTTSLGSTAVNQITLSYTRNKNIQGLSGTGPTLASLGFAAPDQGGIYQLTTQYANWPTMGFNNFNLGPSNSIISQFDNTYQVQDDFSKIIGTHTLKFGADYHWDQVDISHPNNGSDGGFGFNGGETGIDLADMLVGAPSYFYQGNAAALDLRSYYLGIYGEDSWRVTRDLTFNYGLRWEVTPYWSDSKNRNPDLLLGEQSLTFPGAPTGYVFPGDPGIPQHFANTRWNNLGPRIALAYAPEFSDGVLHSIFGDHGKSSIRAGFGMYYTNIEGASTFNFDAPPYGKFVFTGYLPLFTQPYIDRQAGQVYPQPFPLPAPPTNVSPSNPDNSINWAQYLPISSYANPLRDDPSPYTEHLDLSIQRQLGLNTLLDVSYVGSFGHHLILSVDNNPGDPALCLSVSQISQVMPNTATCGPYGEGGTYYPVTGGVINGTRGPFGPNFGNNAYFMDMGNSAYHALQVAMHHTSGRLQFLLSYTYSKAMDQGSGFGDQVLSDNYKLFRSLSIFDMTHNFSFSYNYEIPFDRLFRSDNRLTRGWRVSGITQFTTGLPVTIANVTDRNLRGDQGVDFYGSTDEPNFTPGPILGDTNPRDGKPYFNTSLFSQEPLGGQGTSSRRFFHGPGLNNWDFALLKDVKLTESKSLEFRAELFNAFNHAQFYGANTVDGYYNDGPGSFGMVFNASAPRIAQMGVKFMF
jgi:Carboxypeptidase regulatory-like domain